MRNDPRRRQRGFTLVELMIVVGIIGVIASLAIPNYMRFTARTSRSEMLETVGKIKLHFKQSFDNTTTFAPSGSAIPVVSAVNPTNPGVPVGQPVSWDTTAAGWTDFEFPPEGGVKMRYSYTITAPDSMTIAVCGSFAGMGTITVACNTGAGGGTANYSYLETFSGNGTSTVVENPPF
jgi:prepilin-type N-terminal cleavage/methylation domain-containing protein